MKSVAHPVVPDRGHSLVRAFHDFIRARDFPCVGAKSALATQSIQTLAARDITSAWDDLRIQDALSQFASTLPGTHLKSFAVLFGAPVTLSEEAFEDALWSRLQSLKDKDHWLSYPQDDRVDPDPASPDFAFSIGGQAFFVVGMHPGASRASRRTPMPAMIFNPFEQFEALRQAQRYDRMSAVVRARDEAFCGSSNPMLDHHGSSSAARQFSGRAVEPNWRCPFSPPPGLQRVSGPFGRP